MAKSRVVRFLSVRYLLFSWIANILPVIGVAIGVFFFTVVLSVMGGFVQNLKSRLLRLESHIEIVVKDSFGQIPANADLLLLIKSYSPEIIGISPFQKGDAILQANSRPFTVTLFGVDPELAKTATDFEKHFAEKDLSLLASPQPVFGVIPELKLPPLVLGREMLGILNVGVGDRVTVISTSRDEGPFGLAPSQFPAVVADELYIGHASVDAKWVVGNIDFVNSFFGYDDYWAGLVVKLKDPMLADEVAKNLDVLLAKDGLRAKPWTESNRALLKALQLERWGMSFVLTMVILVGCFGITIVLVLSVKRKAREIAILRSLGMTRWQLGRVYLTQGFVIGSVGVVVGLNAGLWFLNFSRHVSLPFVPFGAWPPPVLVDAWQIGQACLSSLLLAIVASLWPAIQVMRIDPVEVLADRG